MMKRAAIAIATMIGATVLAHYGLAQQPGAGGRTEQSKQGKGRGSFAPAEAGSDLSKPPLPKDDGEKKILEAIDEARQGRRYANVSTADGRLLRQLTEAVNAKRVVELGTSTGESGLWFAMALRKTGGHLYTHDIDLGRISVARENFKRGGVENLITIVEGDAHQTATKNTDPIDVLFIDAEKEGYDAYLKELLPYVRPGGLILAHNMRRPAPNPRYVEAITNSPDLDTSFVLMDGAGLGITLKKR
jgi:caffeoyl-CoA O-methyltransferase